MSPTVEDNRALSFAAAHAKKHSIPIIALFVISPGDYKAHDRSPRRIDFMLRNLRLLKVILPSLSIHTHTLTTLSQSSLAELNIPLQIISHTPRTTVPQRIIHQIKEWNVTRVFANIEYEVDELRRDIAFAEFGRKPGVSIEASFVSDKLLVEPGALETKQGKQYAVCLSSASFIFIADRPCIGLLAMAKKYVPSFSIFQSHLSDTFL